jgi:uncharacterized protein (TIGR03083 family)
MTNNVLPAGLRERVLAAADRARPQGQAVPDVGRDTPTEAFGHAADALYDTLHALDIEHWRLPVLRDLDVQGLIGHLIGVEHDLQRCMAGDPEVGNADHVSSTQPAALSQAGRPPAATMADWRAQVDRTLRIAAESDLDAMVAFHGVALWLRDLLIGRTFELWTHENDIRAVTGLPPSAPQPSTLRPMTQLAADLLPFGAAFTDLHEPISLRLVLTGPGGGTWDVAVGDQAPDPARVGIVADAVGFCRLVSNRIRPGDLDVYVTGEPRRATAILTAATALALD